MIIEMLDATSEALHETDRSIRQYVGSGDRKHWESATRHINDAFLISRRAIMMLDDVVVVGASNPRVPLEVIDDRVGRHRVDIRSGKVVVGDILGDIGATMRLISSMKVFLHGAEIHPLPRRTFRSAYP